jgi:hypothetical protein
VFVHVKYVQPRKAEQLAVPKPTNSLQFTYKNIRLGWNFLPETNTRILSLLQWQGKTFFNTDSCNQRYIFSLVNLAKEK